MSPLPSWCQIVRGVKLSSPPSWCQIVLLCMMVSNCPRCQIVLFAFLVSNCPTCSYGVKVSKVSNCPKCQIVLGFFFILSLLLSHSLSFYTLSPALVLLLPEHCVLLASADREHTLVTRPCVCLFSII